MTPRNRHALPLNHAELQRDHRPENSNCNIRPRRWPPILGLRNAFTVTLTYMRRNRVQAEIAENFGVSQPTISRAISAITPLLVQAVLRLRPTGVTHVAIEVPVGYSQPVYYALRGEDFTEVQVLNPAHVKAVKGHKTDARDCARIAELLVCGLLQGSYLPQAELKEVRDLTRYRHLCRYRHRCAVMPRPGLCRCRIKWPGCRWWPGRNPRHNPAAGWSLFSLRRERRGS